jgi:transcription elongation GreA/GreB family factor
MTPIGAALIGIRKGQSITWITRDGLCPLPRPALA